MLKILVHEMVGKVCLSKSRPRSQDSVVRMATRHTVLAIWGSNSGRCKRCSSSSKPPSHLLGPPTLLVCGYPEARLLGVKRPDMKHTTRFFLRPSLRIGGAILPRRLVVMVCRDNFTSAFCKSRRLCICV